MIPSPIYQVSHSANDIRESTRPIRVHFFVNHYFADSSTSTHSRSCLTLPLPRRTSAPYPSHTFGMSMCIIYTRTHLRDFVRSSPALELYTIVYVVVMSYKQTDIQVLALTFRTPGSVPQSRLIILPISAAHSHSRLHHIIRNSSLGFPYSPTIAFVSLKLGT